MRIVVTLLIVAAFAGALLYATLTQSGAECEACIAFGGREHCGVVRAATKEEAATRAVNNACAVLSQGVTEVVKCQATTPLSLRCREARLP